MPHLLYLSSWSCLAFRLCFAFPCSLSLLTLNYLSHPVHCLFVFFVSLPLPFCAFPRPLTRYPCCCLIHGRLYFPRSQQPFSCTHSSYFTIFPSHSSLLHYVTHQPCRASLLMFLYHPSAFFPFLAVAPEHSN